MKTILPTAMPCAADCACRSPGREIYQRASLGVHCHIRGYAESRRIQWLESLSREQLSRMAIRARGAR